MKKRSAILLLLVAVMLFTLLSGCDKTINDVVGGSLGGPAAGNDSDSVSEKISEDRTYYNEYLGVTYTVKAGWWLYDVSPDNVSTEQGTTSSTGQLDIVSGSGYDNLFLIDAGNVESTGSQSNVEVYITAERSEGVTDIEEYLEEDRAYYLSDDGGNKWSLAETGTFTLADGTQGASTFYSVENEDYPYFVHIYTFPLNDGFFLTVNCCFYEDNTSGASTILDDVLPNLSIALSDMA